MSIFAISIISMKNWNRLPGYTMFTSPKIEICCRGLMIAHRVDRVPPKNIIIKMLLAVTDFRELL